MTTTWWCIQCTSIFLTLSSFSLHAAESWPARPVRFILPSQAGTSADVAARAIAQQLSSKWKQPVVVDNRPGAGAILGTEALAKSPPDGYTIGWVLAAHAVNPSLYSKLPYDTVRDFSGVTPLYSLKAVVVTSPAFAAKDIRSFVEIARAKPTSINFTSALTGSIPHLLGELFRRNNGLDMQYIAYKGSVAAQADVMAGNVAIMFDVLPGALPQIRAGRLRALAIVGDEPARELPNVPLLQGLLPAKALAGWNGVMVPSATPKSIVAVLSRDIAAAVRSPEVQERFATLTVDTMSASPSEFDAFIRDEIARWGEVVRRAGIKLD